MVPSMLRWCRNMTLGKAKPFLVKQGRWFEIRVVCDVQSPGCSLRKIRPAEFVPAEPRCRYWAKRSVGNFVIQYHGPVSNEKIHEIFLKHGSGNGIRTLAEAAALATERVVRKLHPLSIDEIKGCDYEIPKGSISRCYPFNETILYAHVLSGRRKYRVDIMPSVGNGIVELGTCSLRAYVSR